MRPLPARTPNPYLSLEIEEQDLFARTARLFALSRGFVVLGGSGPVRSRNWPLCGPMPRVLPGPIVLLDDGWTALYRRLAQDGRLEAQAARSTRIGTSPRDFINGVERFIADFL